MQPMSRTMPKAVSMDDLTRPDSDRAWRQELSQWQESVQGFMTQTLGDLRDVVQTIETAIQEESKSQTERNNVAANEQAPAPPPAAKSTNSGQASDRQGSIGDRNPPIADGGGDARTSDHRLAQLARRLEEKLGKSHSHAADTR
jgi:hypothetical protein